MRILRKKIGEIFFDKCKKRDKIRLSFLLVCNPKNATQMNKPGKYVAFEELGGFANIGDERWNIKQEDNLPILTYVNANNIK